MIPLASRLYFAAYHAQETLSEITRQIILMLRNLRHRARTITLRTEFWMENGTQKWFEIQA